MSPALSRAFDPLHYRPLLWMAWVALAGVAAGGWWENSLEVSSRADLFWLWPLLPACCGILGFWSARRPMWCCFWGGMALFFAFASLAARRIVPPANDVSLLTAVVSAPRGPIDPVASQVRGVVADYPRHSDFSTQFPLECTSQMGRIWVVAPFGAPLQIGDEISLSLQLKALSQPGNPAERASFWRFVGANCWCSGDKTTVLKNWSAAPGYTFARRIGIWREAILAFYERSFRGSGDNALTLRPFPSANAQLLTAMVFGEGGLSRPLPQSVSDDFRAAGLSHLLVASGEQISILTLLLLGLARGVRLRRAPLLVVVVPLLVLYALLVGSALSIWRAVIGGILATLALLLGRDVDGLSLWGAAVLLLLLFDPLNAWSLSFQLTFAATWGLLTLAPILSRFLESRLEPSKTGELVALCLGAQGAVLPVSLYHFGSFSVAGLGANLVAVPLAEAMIVTGMLGLLFSPLNFLNYYLARGVTSLAHSCALLPGAQLEGRPLDFSWGLGCYLLFLIALLSMSLDYKPLVETYEAKVHRQIELFFSRLRPWMLVVLLLGIGLWLWWLRGGLASGELRVTMLDVGQGESILIQSPNGQNVLIDGGSLSGRERSDIGSQVIVPALQGLGVDRLDMLVLTHADADHCNGLTALAREVPIGTFLDGPSATHRFVNPSQVDYLQLRQALAVAQVPTIVPQAGQLFDLGGATLQVLAPTQPALQSENDNCVVLRLDYGANRFLFTGDIEAAGEARLLSHYADLHCTVLKVAHHGSKTSSTSAFLSATRPAVALISCGKYNRFGHPAPATLNHLQARGVAVFRTDVSGAIALDCDTKNCRVTPFR